MYIFLFTLLSAAIGGTLGYLLGWAGLIITIPLAIMLGIVAGNLQSRNDYY